MNCRDLKECLKVYASRESDRKRRCKVETSGGSVICKTDSNLLQYYHVNTSTSARGMEGDSRFTTFSSTMGGTCSCSDFVDVLAAFEVGNKQKLLLDFAAPIKSKAYHFC